MKKENRKFNGKRTKAAIPTYTNEVVHDIQSYVEYSQLKFLIVVAITLEEWQKIITGGDADNVRNSSCRFNMEV